MSNRPTDDARARSRAEARRRARLAARGEPIETEPTEDEEAPPPSRGGIFSRLFPPAPPLPNRPDPLAGFDPTGPLRPVRERVFLLRRNLLAWLVPGFVIFVAILAGPFYAGGFLELVATFVQFGGIIAAGWYGWQRPTLYGTAASLLGFFAGWSVALFVFAMRGAGPDTFGPGVVIVNLLYGALFQAGLGFIGGWYGGYLRRRQTQLSSQVRKRR